MIKILHAEDQENIQLAEDTLDFLDAIINQVDHEMDNLDNKKPE